MALFFSLTVDAKQGPAKKWEEELLSLGVAGSEPGIEGEEIVPLAKENIATPWTANEVYFSELIH